MKRSLTDHENEIANQIFIAELCFDICGDIPVIEGPGTHLYPFLFNLNMSKGVLSLHSLLDPTGKELSIKNWVAENTDQLSKRSDYEGFLVDILRITDQFQNIAPWPLRHKVVAHLDPKFKHSDFTCSYLTSNHLSAFVKVTADLKEVFFKFSNYADDYPLLRIREQIKSVLEKTTPPR